MKNVIKKNKVLFLAAAIVLAGGICLAVLLLSQTHMAMAADKIQTAEAEAAETAAIEMPDENPTTEATAAPQPTPGNTTLHPDTLSYLVRDKEMRRDYIIPSLDNTVVIEADTWEKTEPNDSDTLKIKALEQVNKYTKAFYGIEITDDTTEFICYTDTSGHRGDIIKLTTQDDAVVCTLAAETLELIEIDYYFVPDGTEKQTDNNDNDVAQSDLAIADRVAAVFDTTVADVNPTGDGSSGYQIWTSTYAVKMENGKLVQFAVMNGKLYAVGVYPSEASMQECVYFDADIQMDPSIVKLAVEQDFTEGEPGTGDMMKEQAQRFYSQFMVAANGYGPYKEPRMTFFIDNSGVRENYWHMEGEKLTMDVASKSKHIVALTCDNLYSPVIDLTKIEYSRMGEKEYEDYVGSIMSSIYGDGYLNASVNATAADDHFCTEDAWMADGSIYEFNFEDGKLKEVSYFADKECFHRHWHRGWKADHEYINTVTGETFIPY